MRTSQRFVYKIHTSRLVKYKWDFHLPIWEARRNEEVVALASSQVLRWIDEWRGLADADSRVREIHLEIREIKRQPNSIENRRRIRQLYSELDGLQFVPDYLLLIIDKKKDYYRACKGFKINGITYKRLLGTNGGIKNSTIVFVNETIVDKLRARINNGRDPNMPLVTAKLEAYKALTCSATLPVSSPHGLLVVNDCETDIKSDIIFISDADGDEPLLENRPSYPLRIVASDGCGMMSPALAERWSQELNLGYIASGMNIRSSFLKGMVFPFDFVEFANRVADDTYLVKDAWGNEVDIRSVELVITTSMLKLWDSYSSCADYLEKSMTNEYSFCIAKVAPETLESERALNYQYLQGYDLSDDDIDELVEPTVREIKDVLGGDWRKTVLFMKGTTLNENNVSRTSNDAVKALMIDQSMVNDPYLQSAVKQTIKGRIEDAKIGALKVHGNYSIAAGDLYALCQSIFGLKVTGLLKAGEVYNQYWADSDADEVACYRSPMSCQNNIMKARLSKSDESRHWYRYIKTCTVFNAWDDTMPRLNGMDFDGDIVMLTDNSVLVRNLTVLPALICEQRRAEKVIPNEEDFIRANINSFGSDIGTITNYITSMYEVRSRFKPESKEYKELSYRIQCGQLYQQNAIDKAKGIICKPMPKSWYQYRAIKNIEADDETKDFYRRIVANKKPYFMTRIYPKLRTKYTVFIKSVNRNSLSQFKMTLEELLSVPRDERTDEHRAFIGQYYNRLPVGDNKCVMNTICHIFERAFISVDSDAGVERRFDHTILMSGCDYNRTTHKRIKQLYGEYNARLKEHQIFVQYERVDKETSMMNLQTLKNDFRRECSKLCQNEEELCDIVVDICYSKSNTKHFAWSMCGDQIIRNLLRKHAGIISYPVADAKGSFGYCGDLFSVESTVIEDVSEKYLEETKVL